MSPHTRRQRGFSLIELMITVVIVGVLAAVGVPGYRKYVERGNRTVAKTALTEIASRQESRFTDRNAYATSFAQLEYPGAFLGRDGNFAAATSRDAIYQVSLAGNPASTTCPPGGTAGATGYTIVAVPVQSQTSDTRCATLCLSSTGVKGASGSSAADCWKR